MKDDPTEKSWPSSDMKDVEIVWLRRIEDAKFAVLLAALRASTKSSEEYSNSIVEFERINEEGSSALAFVRHQRGGMIEDERWLEDTANYWRNQDQEFLSLLDDPPNKFVEGYFHLFREDESIRSQPTFTRASAIAQLFARQTECATTIVREGKEWVVQSK